MRRFQRSSLNVPDPQPIAQALAGHEGLARLGALLAASNARMALVAPLLPGALVRFVKPGPIDEDGWSLLAANAAVAAKLRHLQPRLEALMMERGLSPHRVRIKVQQG
ncbi:hypothetical protein RQP53_19170 [Paucibacter sp. APW11]|uniref:DUF721 domain-containing protein n=1 Tax=Roseateles aquae TaxID=3077235 RepID=A0ABU3PFP4_9BURK|nr:hypothetical protein [Paucibacter sp. APW11]MDT9001410.1 hypothetical protein [Paucibacter sp. APW11]